MRWTALLPVVGALVCAGCGKQDEVRVPEPMQEVFAFTNTLEVTTADKLGKVEADKSVRADFNLDGLQDLAVIESISSGETQVSIYIRRPPSEEGSSEFVSYYRGGWIRPSVDGNVIGVMSSRRGKYTDLILLMARPDAQNAMIHLLSDGKRFSVVKK